MIVFLVEMTAAKRIGRLVQRRRDALQHSAV